MNLVTLYYKFHHLTAPEVFCREHRAFCEELNLLGRIYIATEGINGTLAGQEENILRYQKALRLITGFEKTEFKDDVCDAIPFQKLIVRVRPEIVTLRASMELDPAHEPGKHLEPKEWKKMLDEQSDITLLDVRNNYESAIGYFEGAIKPDVENFYDFEKWVEEADLDKQKPLLMYCTGGIRCEKFSVLMEKKVLKMCASFTAVLSAMRKRSATRISKENVLSLMTA